MLLCACGCGQEKKPAKNGKMWGKYIRGHMFYATRRPLADRLWAKTIKTDGCWLWQGHRDRCGYGKIGDGKTVSGNILTHRAAWMVTYGDIEPGLSVCHKCDNPQCVRPDHLFLGTQRDNVLDSIAKKRWRPWWREQECA